MPTLSTHCQQVSGSLIKKILGGNIAFSSTAPIGWEDVRASAALSGPVGQSRQRILRARIQLWRPGLGATLGWHSGKLNWTVGTLVNVPIGYWELGNPSNIRVQSLGRRRQRRADWLDTSIGAELSTTAGFTFNFENPATNYTTGTEFHAEFAATKIISQQFSFGLVGYYYNQITGDSGPGATLGAFEGQVAALGPAINYTFLIGEIPSQYQSQVLS